MQTLTPDQLTDAAQVLLTTRDFCGDERAAFVDWCADNNIRPTSAAYSFVCFEVNRQWRLNQRAANVPEKHIIY